MINFQQFCQSSPDSHFVNLGWTGSTIDMKRINSQHFAWKGDWLLSILGTFHMKRQSPFHVKRRSPIVDPGGGTSENYAAPLLHGVSTSLLQRGSNNLVYRYPWCVIKQAFIRSWRKAITHIMTISILSFSEHHEQWSFTIESIPFRVMLRRWPFKPNSVTSLDRTV